MAEFVLNNATHASTGLTPFFVNNARRPRVPALLAVRSSNLPAVPTLGGGGRAPTSQSVQSSSDPPQFDKPHQEIAAEVHVVEDHALHGVAYERLTAVDAAMPAASTVANFAPKPTPTPIDSATVSELLLHRQAVTRFVRDALQAAADQQKANADRRGWKVTLSFRRGDRVLLSTDAIQGSAVTNLVKRLNQARVNGGKPSDPATIPALATDRLQPARPESTRPQLPHPQPARRPSFPADDASARALASHARALPSEVPHRQDSPDDEAAPSSHAVPAPTGQRQLKLPRHDGAQTRRGSELPSRHHSLGPSPSSSPDTARESAAQRRQPARGQAASGAPRHRSPRSQATTRQHHYQRDGPPSLVDASGARRWVVERLVDHDVRANLKATPRGTPSATKNRASRQQSHEKHYRVRWLGYSLAKDTWEPRSRLLQDVPDLVSDYEALLAPVSASDYVASLALANANDCNAMTHVQGSAIDCECTSARGSLDVRHLESPQPQDLCEHARNDRSSDVHHRSAATASVGAPIPLALAGCDSGTWSNLPPSARSTSGTLAPPSRTRAHEDPQ
ncbi:unnamed protein product [Phytophthora fragariaefolia]|uniref:Unnamed protein product n=1 Tax=Phytophthora fragariaefolia TaxID=1490495 RepID=A0A9W6XYR1_9STRA|nr:unnamed protein product [Phytophthora fragariaefolia]